MGRSTRPTTGVAGAWADVKDFFGGSELTTVPRNATRPTTSISTINAQQRRQNNASAVQTANPRPKKQAAPQKNIGVTYRQIRVKRGDTIYDLARDYNVQVEEIVRVNNLRAPYRLYVDQIIRVPAVRSYQVQRGDTIYSIGRDQNMSVTELVRANDIKPPYYLREGEVISLHDNQAAPTDVIDDRRADYTPSLRRDLNPPPRRPDGKSATDRFVDQIPRRAGRYFSWPVDGQVISLYGPKKDGTYNDGINIVTDDGASVRAAENGVVTYAGNDLNGYGNMVLIKHDGDWVTAYAHTAQLLVQRGDVVQRGQQIGFVGNSGYVKTPQLHFQVREKNRPVDPEKYLR